MPSQTSPDPLADRASYTHWAREQVRFSDTDMWGHVNNLAFGAFAETGRVMFMRRFFERTSPHRVTFLPVRISLGLLGEVFWPSDIDVGNGIIAIGTTSLRVGQGLFAAERCFGTCETIFVLIDEATRRPRAIPDDMREWAQPYLIPAAS